MTIRDDLIHGLRAVKTRQSFMHIFSGGSIAQAEKVGQSLISAMERLQVIGGQVEEDLLVFAQVIEHVA
ncbi:MAG TPA: hypothetical protein VK703_01170 [Candidatus Acidoferrales bacterium]|nr:hypothetical protein [Candidatus Acidoferrales bacterium]